MDLNAILGRIEALRGDVLGLALEMKDRDLEVAAGKLFVAEQKVKVCVDRQARAAAAAAERAAHGVGEE